MRHELSPEAEKAIDRAAKLLALAQHNNNEHEAAAAMDAALRILEAYNLDMALVERRKGEGVHTGTKRDDATKGGGLYKWQRTVWEYTAHMNFCRYFSIKGLRAGSKYENRVVGAPVNVRSTTMMAEYLVSTIERIAVEWVRDVYPEGTSRFIRDAIAYREGMADRIATKLWNARNERTEADRRRAEEQAASHSPSTPGMSIALVDVIQSEEDLNSDYLYGNEPGTHARWRAERKAKQLVAAGLEAEAMARRDMAEAADPALRLARERREAKEEAERAVAYEKLVRQAGRRRQPAARSHTYFDGYARGADVGIDLQVTDDKKHRIA